MYRLTREAKMCFPCQLGSAVKTKDGGEGGWGRECDKSFPCYQFFKRGLMYKVTEIVSCV